YRDLQSFPTRRSSDLWGADADGSGPAGNPRGKAACRSWADATRLAWLPLRFAALPARRHAASGPPAEYSCTVLVSRGLHWYCPRSEEHTSELQSPDNL